MSCDDYDDLIRHAESRCQLCGRTAGETGHGYLVIDHDPAIGDWAVRGLLCSTCNQRIEYGSVDAPEYLANPWHTRYAGQFSDEPPLGTSVRAGRRRFQRMSKGWVATDSFRGGPFTWDALAYTYGPHNIKPDVR